MTAGEIANRKLVSINEEQTAYEAAVLMSAADIGSVVVTFQGVPTGIFTERDLMKRVVLEGLDPKDVRIKEVMSKPLITINESTSLGDAALQMIKNKIRRLLVEDERKVVGIITQRDLQKATLEYFSALATSG